MNPTNTKQEKFESDLAELRFRSNKRMSDVEIAKSFHEKGHEIGFREGRDSVHQNCADAYREGWRDRDAVQISWLKSLLLVVIGSAIGATFAIGAVYFLSTL
jgi:hypothetical protein